MAVSQVRTLRAAQVALLAGGVVSLLAGMAFGQTRQWNSGVGSWYDGTRWSPNGLPLPSDITWISNGGPANATDSAAVSQDLIVAANGNGGLLMRDGLLQIQRDMVLGRDAGATGTTSIGQQGGSATAVISQDLTVGQFGAGSMRMMGSGTMTVGRFMAVGRDNGSNGYFQQDNRGSVIVVNGNLTVGDRTGSTGVYDLDNGTLQSDRTFIGRDTGSSGRMNIGANGVLEIGGFNGFMNIGTTFSSPNAIVRVNGGTIRAVGANAADALVEVSGANAELSGIGRYDVKVRYNSQQFASPGIGSNKVTLTFAKDTIQKSAKLNVTQGLTVGNAAADVASRNALSAKMVQGTEFHLAWAGSSATDQGIGYTLPQGWNRAEAPEIRMAWDTSQVTGPAGDQIATRARLWQFGQNSRGELAAPTGGPSFNPTVSGDKPNQIRNITTSAYPNLSLIEGKTSNMGGEFDVAVGAKGVAPVHQDPRIAALHARGLTGEGVVFGQVEPGSPFITHGAFDNWQSADPTALRAVYSGAAPAAGASSGHATRVASIMMGYDPLGIHVDHESRFEAAGNRINNGFGFTGVAPKGKLLTNGSSDVAAITAVATGNVGGTPVKIMNMSAGVPGSSANGQSQSERAIDHFVEANGIIFTKSAGNAGRTSAITTPGGAYNAIVVGNLEYGADVSYPTNFDPANAALSGSSSQGPTFDGRSKPDITALGTGNYSAFTMENEYEVPLGGGRFTYISQIDPAYMESGNRGLYSTRSRQSGSEPGVAVEGTSFAAPTVAGVAGLMVQQGTISHAGADRAEAHNPLSIKSVLMTTADKRPYGGDTYRWSKGVDGAGDDANSRIPLSFRWGAGMLNPIGAVDLIATSPQEHNDHVTSSGWDYNATLTSTSRDTIGGGVDLGPGHLYDVRFDSPMVTTNFSFVATLNWFNHVGPADGAGNYAAGTLVNLDLMAYLWDGTNAPVLIAQSDSLIDNVEHIWLRNGLTIPGDANGGMSFTSLILRVTGAGWRGVEVAEPYALSWKTYLIPTPSGVSVLSVLGLVAIRRRR
jgi:hypothetical protein